MLTGMVYQIVKEDSDYTLYATDQFELYLVRFACAITLHLILYPEVRRGLVIMKYVNNHPHLFSSSRIPFIIGLM